MQSYFKPCMVCIPKNQRTIWLYSTLPYFCIFIFSENHLSIMRAGVLAMK